MERYPLRRPESGRLIFGTCQAIADHLAVNVWIVRAILCVLTFVQFAGIFAYLFLVFTIPSSTEVPDRVEKRFVPSLRTRLLVLAGLILVAAIVLWASNQVFNISLGLIVSITLIVIGAGLAWTTSGGSIKVQLIRIISGIVLLVIGVLIFAVRDEDFSTMTLSVIIGLSVLVIALGGLWPAATRMMRELDQARRETAAESARADIAAHLHDSVLQTLTLIRNSSHDPSTVTRLARVQERQLRSWLYEGEKESSTISQSLKAMVGEVEDLYGTEVDYVAVGDGEADEHSAALLAAGREALVNAVRHGAAPVMFYAEFSKDGTDLFIRDHGNGFDIDQIPDDRQGVKGSILGRTERHGGTATIRRRDPGTEVHIHIPRGVS